MKQLLLFACLSMFSFGLSAQVFVDATAAGTADGSSWDNAFTDLAAALDAAAAGSEVWVAAGTYVTPTDTSFVINKGISLLGGFAGDETSADAADPAANVTILSGDVNGDDVAGTFDSLARLDNQRVLFVADTSSAPNQLGVVVDGFTISDGSRDGFVDGVLDPWAGGGIFATGQVTISNVIFVDNFSDFGSDVAIVGFNADNSVLDNVTIRNSHPGPRWAVYTRNTDGVVVRNSDMGYPRETAATPQGMIFALDVLDFTVEDCTFSDINTSGRGGAVHVEGVAGLATVRNVTVDNSTADLGGALYLRNFDIYEDANGDLFTGNTLVENVTMTDIGSSRWGGAVLFSQVNSVVNGATVTDAETLQGGGLGGGLYLQTNADPGVLPLTSDWSNVDLDNISTNSVGGGIFMFIDPDYVTTLSNIDINNASGIGSGGGLYLNGGGNADSDDNIANLSNIAVSNCSLLNRADGSGGFGAGVMIFAQDINIKGATITGNSGGEGNGNGGGLYAQNPGIVVSIDDATFMNNVARGGSGLTIWGPGQQSSVTNSTFTENGNTIINPGNAFRGGAMTFFHGDGAQITVDNVDMLSNSLDPQPNIVSGGGGIYMADLTDNGANPSTIRVSNSLIQDNIANDAANGGAVYILDAVNVEFDNVDMLSNSANVGGAIYARKFSFNDTINDVPFVRLPDFNISVKNSSIALNVAAGQGGAFNSQDGAADFTNVAFSLNQSGQSGGAIIFNGSSAVVDEGGNQSAIFSSAYSSEIVNCSFYGNSKGNGFFGNDIALFQNQNVVGDTAELSLTVTLQNNAFFTDFQDDFIVEIEPNSDLPVDLQIGDIEVNSLGGNFFNAENGPDADGNPLFENEADIFTNISDPEILFVDPLQNENDFPLLRPVVDTTNNPLINNGTTGPLVPEIDIVGNPRGERPDIGAYELDFDLVNVQAVGDSGLDMDFFPNPTVDVVNIRSNDASITAYTLLLSDANGRVLRAHRFNGATNTLSLTDVPSGVYTLQLVVDGNVYTQQVVKQ